MQPEFSSDLALARNGDRDALARVLCRCGQGLDELARREIGSDLAARLRVSDLVQSTYLDIVRGIDSFRGTTEEELVHWMSRILGNNARDSARFFTAERRAARADGGFDPESAPSPQHTPSHAAIVTEDLLLVHRAMDDLTEEQRIVLQLKVVDGLSHEEIGDRIGRSVTATRSLLARARTTLLLAMDRRQQGKRSTP